MQKKMIVSEISRLVDVEPPNMSSGSTEPRRLFELIDESLALGLTAHTKQAMAREIVELSGGIWLSAYESSGATITRGGLLAVLSAVQVITGVEHAPATPTAQGSRSKID